MATALAEPDYSESVWAEHETFAAHTPFGDAKAAEGSAQAHEPTAGRMTEEIEGSRSSGGKKCCHSPPRLTTIRKPRRNYP